MNITLKKQQMKQAELNNMNITLKKQQMKQAELKQHEYNSLHDVFMLSNTRGIELCHLPFIICVKYIRCSKILTS